MVPAARRENSAALASPALGYAEGGALAPTAVPHSLRTGSARSPQAQCRDPRSVWSIEQDHWFGVQLGGEGGDLIRRGSRAPVWAAAAARSCAQSSGFTGSGSASWWIAPAKDSAKPGPSDNMISTRSWRCTSNSASTAAMAAVRSISVGALITATGRKRSSCRGAGFLIAAGAQRPGLLPVSAHGLVPEQGRARPARRLPADQRLPADPPPAYVRDRVSPSRGGPIAVRWLDRDGPAHPFRTRNSPRRDQLLVPVTGHPPPSQRVHRRGVGACRGDRHRSSRTRTGPLPDHLVVLVMGRTPSPPWPCQPGCGGCRADPPCVGALGWPELRR